MATRIDDLLGVSLGQVFWKPESRQKGKPVVPEKGDHDKTILPKMRFVRAFTIKVKKKKREIRDPVRESRRWMLGECDALVDRWWTPSWRILQSQQRQCRAREGFPDDDPPTLKSVSDDV
ncbi:uncharacterized protein LOC121996854 [Zingiber officinale]|uniref:uncharacterized protein LOC121996854 n=1 Tax=Zingiber officinale TaxID=94328 RepID=UPI001C4C8769|nr:uncharacterized protein LOC121996854 [Zingiber officinale]